MAAEMHTDATNKATLRGSQFEKGHVFAAALSQRRRDPKKSATTRAEPVTSGRAGQLQDGTVKPRDGSVAGRACAEAPLCNQVEERCQERKSLGQFGTPQWPTG